MVVNPVMSLSPRTKLTEDLRKKLVGLEVRFPAALEATADYVADYDFMALVDSICRDLLEKESFTVAISEEPRTISRNKFKWCSVEVRRIFIETERVADGVRRLSWGSRTEHYKIYAEAEKITVPGGTVIRLVNLEVVPVKPVNR